MGKEDNTDVEVNVDVEEMSNIDNYKVKIIIIDQFRVSIIRGLDILNFIVGKGR